MTQLVLSVDDRLAKALERVSNEQHVAPELFALDALKRQLALEWLKRTQAVVAPAARAAGYENEDDILNDIS